MSMRTSFSHFGVIHFFSYVSAPTIWETLHFNETEADQQRYETEAGVCARVLGSSPLLRPDDIHALRFQKKFLNPYECAFFFYWIAQAIFWALKLVLMYTFTWVSEEAKSPTGLHPSFLRSSPNPRCHQNNPKQMSSFCSHPCLDPLVWTKITLYVGVPEKKEKTSDWNGWQWVSNTCGEPGVHSLSSPARARAPGIVHTGPHQTQLAPQGRRETHTTTKQIN